MKLFAPSYYEKFKCIADRCRHSCCIGWEIDVDAEAISRFEALGESGERILSTIDFEGETPHYRLTSRERCPHLDDRGLCRIISEYGEGYLCDICREHPRFYNFPIGRCEVGLGAACEEAARLILSSSDYGEICEISENGEEEVDLPTFDALAEREETYGILSDSSLSYRERLFAIGKRYSVSIVGVGDERWRELLSRLEYLDSASRDLFVSSYSSVSAPACEEYAERALAYFIYRHASSAETEEELMLGVGLALFLERLFSSLTSSLGRDDLEAHAAALRLISEEIEYSQDNTDLIRSYLADRK